MILWNNENICIDINKCSFNFIFDDIGFINFKNPKYIKNIEI